MSGEGGEVAPLQLRRGNLKTHLLGLGDEPSKEAKSLY